MKYGFRHMLSHPSFGKQVFVANITAKMITYWDSLALYRGHRFMRENNQERYSDITNEDYILFEVESSTWARYGSIRPGTVTVEGFGVEYWYYEMNFGGCPEKLHHDIGKFGWNPTFGLREFVLETCHGYVQQHSVRNFWQTASSITYHGKMIKL